MSGCSFRPDLETGGTRWTASGGGRQLTVTLASGAGPRLRIVDDVGADRGSLTLHDVERRPERPRPAPTPKPRPSLARPGDWLASLIYVFTLGAVRPCTTCRTRAAKLNRAGWIWCWMLIISPKFWMSGS